MLAVSAYGAYSSAQSGKAASKQAKNAAAQEAASQEQQLALQQQAMQYTKDQNSWRMAQGQENQDYTRAWSEADLQRRLAAAGSAEERMQIADAMDMAERIRQINQINSNQQLSEQERQQALSYLDYNQRQAAQEREFDVNRLARMEDKAGYIGDRMEQTLSGLGSMVKRPEYGASDVNSAYQDILGGYMSAADRAADRVASVNEAQDIARGMDSSSTGESSRRRVLRDQVSPLYEQAQAKARLEAQQYISGLAGLQTSYGSQELARRNQTLDEVSKALSPELQALMQMKTPGSATSYQAPTSIGSALQQAFNVNKGYNDQIANPVQTYGTSAPTFNLASLNLDNLSGGSSGGGSGGSNALGWAQEAAKGYSAAGSGITDLITQLSKTQWGKDMTAKWGG
jgi:hypothetical protein